jgi:hypothetical protein
VWVPTGTASCQRYRILSAISAPTKRPVAATLVETARSCQAKGQDCEDHTRDATIAFPVRNYVSGDLENYVSDNRLNVGIT